MAQGIGGGLAFAGNQNLGEAQDLLGKAADQEQERILGNKQREQQRKAGNVQLGAMGGAALGAYYGASMGPVGMLIGGVLGAVGGSLF